MDAKLQQEFYDEVRVMSRLDHPNIVSFIGACMEPPHLVMVMELCETSLYQFLHESPSSSSSLPRRLSLSDKIHCVYDIADALAYLHAQVPPIIHRDLKSMNLLLISQAQQNQQQHPMLKLCDFGLVSTTVTQAGTPSYMPPELLLGKSFSKAVDVFAYAMVVWEIFTENIPYRGYSIQEIKDEVVRGHRLRIPTIDCPVEIQVSQCFV